MTIQTTSSTFFSDYPGEYELVAPPVLIAHSYVPAVVASGVGYLNAFPFVASRTNYVYTQLTSAVNRFYEKIIANNAVIRDSAVTIVEGPLGQFIGPEAVYVSAVGSGFVNNIDTVFTGSTSLLAQDWPVYIVGTHNVKSIISAEGVGHIVSIPATRIKGTVSIPLVRSYKYVYGRTHCKAVSRELTKKYYFTAVANNSAWTDQDTWFLDQTTVSLTDTFAPYVDNLTPASGAVFVNPSSNISLDLVDNCGINRTGIGGRPSVNVYADGNHIIIDGVVNVVYSGSVTLTEIEAEDRVLRVVYTPDISFTSGAVIPISGSMEDIHENYGEFSYSFHVAGIADLLGYAYATPDTTAPILTNIYPPSGSINISAGSSVRFNIIDTETGVDLDTLNIYINNELVVTNGVDTASSGTVDISGDKFDYGFEYIPDTAFTYNTAVLITVVVSDNNTISPGANTLNTSYAFTVVPDDMLQISDIFIDIGESVNLNAPAIVYAYVWDLTHGVDLNNTYFVKNGVPVSTMLTPMISGSITYGYKLEYILTEPYYEGLLCFEVHAQNMYPYELEW